MMPAAWRIAFTVPAASVRAFADIAGGPADAVSTFEIGDGRDWLVEIVSMVAPDRPLLAARVAVLAEALGLAEPDVAIEPLPRLDWLSRSLEGFTPRRIGRYFIHGSHHRGGVPAGAVGLRVDAATAFGSGEHASTAGCLSALDRLARRQRVQRVLDMGCGSGILAIAAAKTWRVPVVAVDIDAEAARVARLNAKANGVSALVAVAGGNGYEVAVVRRAEPFDLITANILARPLARMAPDLARHLAEGGVAVLSGLLARQERHVLAAHRSQGLHLAARLTIGDWRTLIMARRSVSGANVRLR
jgi:ribosomal protein L11 methyltransferase